MGHTPGGSTCPEGTAFVEDLLTFVDSESLPRTPQRMSPDLTVENDFINVKDLNIIYIIVVPPNTAVLGTSEK